MIKVPVGTIVRQLPWDDPRRAKDFWESEEESLQNLSASDKRDKMRDNRWVHYPRYQEANIGRDSFKEAETAYYKQERMRKYENRRKMTSSTICLDLDKEDRFERPLNAPLGTRHQEPLGHLVAAGGLGGLGNPHFISADNRSPKFATRGLEGERLTLSLELKLLADVGLVGMPNAGKSTLLRALTGGRAKSKVASYAFTTLNPVVGVVRVAEDGTVEGGIDGHFDLFEKFRFTIADNPGLIEHASENVGLGHAFLRSMERSHVLVYVVDLSGDAPWAELGVLREELEKYQPGMSEKGCIVVANKADLLASDGNPAEIEKAKTKLKELENYVKTKMVLQNGRRLDVIATAAKFSQNLTKVVALMQAYVQEARDRMANGLL